MAEHPGAVTFKDNPITLQGETPEVGASATNAALTAGDMSEVNVDNWKGKVRILNVVPSLDTPVCDVQTRTFNQRASELGDDALVLTVSRDLPFAQNRWCGAAGIERVAVLSDYKERAFGNAYGLGMKELGLLARSVFVIDRGGVIRYREIVAEQTDEPDYDAALSAAETALKG